MGNKTMNHFWRVLRARVFGGAKGTGEQRTEPSGSQPGMLDWSPEPGFHERHLMLRHNNVFFPPERRIVSMQVLLAAREMDFKMFIAFVEAAALAIEISKAGAISPDNLREAGKTIANGKGLGPRANDLLSELQARLDADFDALLDYNHVKDWDEQKQLGMKNMRRTQQRLNQLTQHQAYIDVFHAQPADVLPTLLSCSAEDLRFLFRELPPEPEFAKLSKGMQGINEDARAFAIELMRDSPEARAKLLQEPDKLALLGITAI